jgi:hypothetical protein
MASDGGLAMRAAAWVGGLVGWLGLAGAALAQAGGDATVRVPAAEVRGGRSDIFPVTGILRQGQSIRVLREEDGYLAITPPAGSSSWIPDRVLRHSETPGRGRVTSAYVLADDVPVRLGSTQSAAPLQIETVRLRRGTIVRVLGEKAFAEGKEWWRIQPPPAEVRYVAKDAVAQPSSMVVSASPGGSPPAAVNGRSPDPLWTEAEQAEQRRDYARARDLYSQLASKMAQPDGDHDLAIRCYNRVEQLDRRTGQLATWPARQQAPGVLVSSARPNPVAPAPPPVAPVPNSTTVTSSGSVTSGPGWLRRSGVQIDGRSAYVLEDDRGQPKYYLLAQTGLNMEMFVNRPVEVFGPMVQRPDLSGGGYISVNRLHLLR